MPFYCHQCKKEIDPIEPERQCPECEDFFVEEIEDDTQHPREFVHYSEGEEDDDDMLDDVDDDGPPHPNMTFPNFGNMNMFFPGGAAVGGGQAMAAAPGVPQFPAGNMSFNLMDLFRVGGAAMNPAGGNAEQGGGPGEAADPPPRNPQDMLLENIFNALMNGGAGGGAGGGGFPGGLGNLFGAAPLASNMGDYHFGPGLDALIQQLMENDDSSPFGTPPAAKGAVTALPQFNIEQSHVDASLECPVCFDTYAVDDEVRRMPCEHIFHSGCLLPWLETHNSCPVCRYELLTDDPDYERKKKSEAQREASAASSSNPGGDGDVD